MPDEPKNEREFRSAPATAEPGAPTKAKKPSTQDPGRGGGATAAAPPNGKAVRITQD